MEELRVRGMGSPMQSRRQRSLVRSRELGHGNLAASKNPPGGRHASFGRVPLDFSAVTAQGLVKMYGATRALSGVDLELSAGCVTVIEGPNGAGKSTLLEILSLLSRPTRGTLRFGQYDAWADRQLLRGSLGVMAHAAMLYPDLTGQENLSLFARMYGVPNARVAAMGERFEATG